METKDDKEGMGSILDYGFLRKGGAKEKPEKPQEKKNVVSATAYNSNNQYNSEKTQAGSLQVNKGTISSGSAANFNLKKVKSRPLLKNSQSQPSFNVSSIYEKEKERQMVRDRKLEEKRDEQFQLEMSELKPYIKMSENSREINRKREGRNNSLDIPVYMRTTKINEKNTMRLRDLIQKENDEQAKTFQKSNTRVFNKKKFEMFLQSNEKTLKNKQKKIEKIKKQIEILEMTSSEYTFMPELNKKSLLLAYNPMYGFNEEKRIYRSKSYIRKGFEKLQSDFTFAPKTNIGFKGLNKSSLKSNVPNSSNAQTITITNVNAVTNGTNFISEKAKKTANKTNPPTEIKENENDIEKKPSRNYCSAYSNTQKIISTIDNSKNSSDPFGTLYKLNVRQTLPGKTPENVININNPFNSSATKSVIESFL